MSLPFFICGKFKNGDWKIISSDPYLFFLCESGGGGDFSAEMAHTQLYKGTILSFLNECLLHK